jgi:hypothetical protein
MWGADAKEQGEDREWVTVLIGKENRSHWHQYGTPILMAIRVTGKRSRVAGNAVPRFNLTAFGELPNKKSLEDTSYFEAQPTSLKPPRSYRSPDAAISIISQVYNTPIEVYISTWSYPSLTHLPCLPDHNVRKLRSLSKT